MGAWAHNSPEISNADALYRSVLDRPNLATADAVTGEWRVHPGAFQQKDSEGISTHLDSILCARHRAPETLYPAPRGTIRLGVAIPRHQGLGVLHIKDVEEPDLDLSEAHCEIRTESPQKLRRDLWRPIALALALGSEWIIFPAPAGQ